MRRVLIVCSAFTAAAYGAACGGGSGGDPVAPTTPATGSYTLQTVNGAALPYADTAGFQLVSERLQINSDGTFGDTAQFVRPGGVRTDTRIASWSGTNGAVRLFDGIAGTTVAQGTLSGATLTLAGSGLTKAYQKQ